jgi:hypothetical protein
MEQAVHHGRAAGVGHQLALVADEPAGRRVEDKPHAAAARRSHLDHLGLSLRQLVDDDAGMLLVDVDDDLLDRLEQRSGGLVLAHDNLRARHAELESLAAHGLDQDGELQLAAAGNDAGVGARRRLDLERDVAFGLAQEPLANHPALDLVAFGSGERRVVDQKGHR